ASFRCNRNVRQARASGGQLTVAGRPFGNHQRRRCICNWKPFAGAAYCVGGAKPDIGAPVKSELPERPETFVTTYYPDAIDLAGATPSN
ncbi:MAG TPA: hypothetical protein VGR88_09820, partial [Ktedonobacterales bacterium]|nr:hypothetical protein [Ktedonobacterales bacterium]